MISHPRDANPDELVVRLLEGLKAYERAHPHAEIEAYRRNSASIRVRIVDPDFAGKDDLQREDVVWQVLDNLPEEVRSDITMLVLITPAEVADSLASREFQDPTPSQL